MPPQLNRSALAAGREGAWEFGLTPTITALQRTRLRLNWSYRPLMELVQHPSHIGAWLTPFGAAARALSVI